MSSRALRKLQRQQEEQNRLAELEKTSPEHDEEEDESSQDEIKPSSTAKKSAFELLADGVDPDEDQDDGDETEDGSQPRQASPQRVVESSPARAATSSSKSKKKKKAKKARKKNADTSRDASKTRPANGDDDNELDDIDRALKDLQMKDGGKPAGVAGQAVPAELQAFYKLLSVDSKNLKVLNEMKRLFGSSVLEGESEGGAGRRRGRGPQQLDLGAVFDRRHNPMARGQGLSERVLRKNIFIQGKESWLNEPGGGLGMDIEERAEDHTTEYRYVHSMAYRTSQQEFEVCVETMDPQRMIHFLQFNPYHISGLLQVSEIAKQHQEAAVAVDLLERALFSFGRAAHSTFHAAIIEGTARMDFRRPENRELWLAGYRYVKSLGQRGTWRTAYEWAKLLFSLDPEGDPYQIRLVIDQLAVRAGQFEQLIQLAAIDPATLDWGQKMPNICISLALAHSRLGHGAECRKVLAYAVQQFPWIIERLLKELDIDRIPKSVWAKTPRTPREKLHTEAYVHRAKDMWNTPEAVALLVEVAETTDALAQLPPPDETNISLDEARHIILDETPSLIGLLPRVFTEARTSAGDPLPPEDNEPSYDPANPHETAGVGDGGDADSLSDGSESGTRPAGGNAGLRGWATRMMARIGGWPAEGESGDGAEADGDAAAAAATNWANIVQAQRRGTEEQLLAEQDDAMLAEALRQSEAEYERVLAAAAPPEPEPEAAASAASAAPAAATTASADRVRSDAPSPSPNRAIVASTIPAQADADAPARATATAAASEPTDPQATQRFLAGRGLVALKEFVAAHGTDEAQWGFRWDSSEDARAAPVAEYVRRARALPQQQRRFILDFALPQGAGKEVGELVRGLVGR